MHISFETSEMLHNTMSKKVIYLLKMVAGFVLRKIKMYLNQTFTDLESKNGS